MQYLYLIDCQKLSKIGIANDVTVRLAQLAIGNPFELTILSCFRYGNAEAVERSIHQKFTDKRIRGEWFDLTIHDIRIFNQICRDLGGEEVLFPNPSPYPSEIDDQEIIQESDNQGARWDFALMFSEGWRMETNNHGKNWRWRRGTGDKRDIMAGGRVSDLPCPVEEMRKRYADQA